MQVAPDGQRAGPRPSVRKLEVAEAQARRPGAVQQGVVQFDVPVVGGAGGKFECVSIFSCLCSGPWPGAVQQRVVQLDVSTAGVGGRGDVCKGVGGWGDVCKWVGGWQVGLRRRGSSGRKRTQCEAVSCRPVGPSLPGAASLGFQDWQHAACSMLACFC